MVEEVAPATVSKPRNPRGWDRAPAQRLAKLIEKRGGDVPAWTAHLHTPIRWPDDGETNRDGILLCPGHHTRAHDTRWTFQKTPAGKYTLDRRA